MAVPQRRQTGPALAPGLELQALQSARPATARSPPAASPAPAHGPLQHGQVSSGVDCTALGAGEAGGVPVAGQRVQHPPGYELPAPRTARRVQTLEVVLGRNSG